MTVLEVFDHAFEGWVKAFSSARGLAPLTGEEYCKFRASFDTRIPSSVLGLIGEGLREGALETERGYFVRLSSDPRRLASQYVFNGKDRPQPCWELYVHLAEAVRLIPVAHAAGLDLRMEDRLMDLTLSRGSELVAYVEVKVEAKDAAMLLEGVARYGLNGIVDTAPSRRDDSLKKARYILCHRPALFGVRALGYSRDLAVKYLSDVTFELSEIGDGFENEVRAPTTTQRGLVPSKSPQDEPRIDPQLQFNPIDALWAELSERCPELEVDVGAGQTAYNVRAQVRGRKVVLLGVYRGGELWTAIGDLLPVHAAACAKLLGQLDIDLPVEKSWAFWRCKGLRANVQDLDGAMLARQFRAFLDEMAAQ